jgi:bacteriocin-like protein
MDTNTKASEIRELTNHELNAVNGGAYNAHLSQGGGAGAGKVEPYQTGGSGGSHS